jgi:hypothetical protein
MIEYSATEITKTVADQIHHLGVDFYRIDLPGFMVERLQYAGASPGTQYQNPVRNLQVVG